MHWSLNHVSDYPAELPIDYGTLFFIRVPNQNKNTFQ